MWTILMSLRVLKVIGKSMIPSIMTLSIVNPNQGCLDPSWVYSPEFHVLQGSLEYHIG